MAILPINTLKTQVAAALADNITGDISAQDSRDSIINTIDSLEDITGRTLRFNVVNETGTVIPMGTPVRRAGVDGLGNISIAPAQANSISTAFVIGVTAQNIAPGAVGEAYSRGVLTYAHSYNPGDVLYLSDTVAGSMVATPPNIPTITALVTSATTIDIRIINAIVLPTTLCALYDFVVPDKALTTTPLDLNNYATKASVILEGDELTGRITTGRKGIYAAAVTLSCSFPSATATRVYHIEVYNYTTASSIFAATKNIPRDSVEDMLSMGIPFTASAGDVIGLRATATPNITLTISNIAFTVKSEHIS